MFLMFKCVSYCFCHINQYPIPTVCRTKMSFSCDNLLVDYILIMHIAHILLATCMNAHSCRSSWHIWFFWWCLALKAHTKDQGQNSPKMCGIKFLQQMHNIKSIVSTSKLLDRNNFWFFFSLVVSSFIVFICSPSLNIIYGPLLIAYCLRFIMVWFTVGMNFYH